jgi:hypothetical protein
VRALAVVALVVVALAVDVVRRAVEAYLAVLILWWVWAS